MSRFVALARVSSREQEREGFSLDVQEDALRRYAATHDGEIVQFYRIAETASKRDERKTFKELLAYVKKHAAELDGMLFYKVDRAARNLFDYVELERLEAEHGVPMFSVAQPTDNTPAGRMQRRMLANMAAFYTEQQSLDVREGQARRVMSGLFVGKAPYGYRNVRIDGRSCVRVDPQDSKKVQRIFELYAYHNHTLDSMRRALYDEGLFFTDRQPHFARSKLHDILHDRSYLGELPYKGQWLAGAHESLIDNALFARVQTLLGQKTYSARSSVYGAGMITCGHCGHPIVVEIKSKDTRQGPREYRYYRCAKYNTKGHPRVRLREAEIDEELLAVFRRMVMSDEGVLAWIRRALRAKAQHERAADADRIEDLQREVRTLQKQTDTLLNMRLLGEIESDTFTSKHDELTSRIAHLRLLIESADRSRDETADLAVKVFELSQSLEQKWVTADIPEKRRLLEIVCLNLTLNGRSVSPEMRKPFDVIAEGLLGGDGRGDWI